MRVESGQVGNPTVNVEPTTRTVLLRPPLTVTLAGIVLLVFALGGGWWWTTRRDRTRLSAWRAMDLPVVEDVVEDQSVRVDTTQPLLDQCYQEILRDRTGFTVYGTLAWRNDPWLQRGVIYARSLGPLRDRRLMDRYPQHEYYLYAPLSPEGQAPPVLRRLERRSLAETTGEVHK